MSVTAGVSDAALATGEKRKGKINPTKVKRYWPGKAPEWADDTDEDGDDIRMSSAFPRQDGSPDPAALRSDDPRLRRLAAVGRIDVNRDEAARSADHRRIRQAEIISTEDAEEEEDEEGFEERRRRRRETEELPLPVEDEEEESSEYETDSEEEERITTGITMVIKAMFVPKPERDTIAERERLAKEERGFKEKEQRKAEQRKVETRRILIEEINKEAQIQKNSAEIDHNVVTDDEMNQEQEYEAWKVREIGRIKRKREVIRMVMVMKEKEEIAPPPRPKKKRRFMQKYYHKGAYFQDDDAGGDVERDFSAPTGEDKMDRTVLPKVMQVKNFGRRGRTKWTHLRNEDTTDRDRDNAGDPVLRAKYTAKMAGMNAPVAKPKGSKRMKVDLSISFRCKTHAAVIDKHHPLIRS